jgi:hypothetical protein
MKTYLLSPTIVAFALLSFNVSATVHYVDLNCTNPVSPYTSWATAATNIQHAISASLSGDIVLVTNGIYQTGGYSSSGSNRIYLLNNVTVRSVNGPAFTTIKGYQVPGTTNGAGAVRCAYLNSGTVLSGFTLTNGATSNTEYGGGAKCASLNAVVTNCVIAGNAAFFGGAGAYSGTLINCILTDNYAGLPNALGWGGGASSSTLINCLLVRNFTTYIGAGAYNSTLINCTVVSNTATSGAAGASYCTLNNSIVYYNSPDNGVGTWGSTFYSCETFPLPLFGTGNITNPPVLANPAGGDYHLNPGSPCINAGSNAFVISSIDLDGNPRIIAGRVDMGAYEFPPLVRYVNLSNLNPVSPFTNWPTAATNIQDAIDAAADGDRVLVTNGIYQTGGRVIYDLLTNRIALTKSLTVESLNGPLVTIIEGNPTLDTNAVRCVYMTNGATLTGFTLTNGSTLQIEYEAGDFRVYCGGGVWSESLEATISNCVITSCTASLAGGGAESCTLYRCTLTGNSANDVGGGADVCVLYDCTLTGNSTSGLGGGVESCTLFNSVLSGNTAFQSGGADGCTLYNCTLVGNYCNESGGGLGGGAGYSTLNNCIIYYNNGNNNFHSDLYYCCTAPLPADGWGNFTNEPAFASVASGDFHLQSNSVCINAGNNAYVIATNDLDDNRRISGGTVDIGAYEFQNPSSALSYAWLQRYGLTNNGSADYADPDGDGLNNWNEWLADTSPLNANDYLHITSFTRDGTYNLLQWTGKSTRLYRVERCETLDGASPWETIITNATPGWNNVGFDSTAPQYYYRIEAVRP